MNTNYKNSTGRSFAIVSGKGGSGKTMIAATMARILDEAKAKVLLIDTDFGTGGLSYYMGLNTVSNISVGLADFVMSHDLNDYYPQVQNTLFGQLPVPDELHNFYEKIIQPMKGFDKAEFMCVGQHREYPQLNRDSQLESHLTNIINLAKETVDVVILDCRGGIDDDSLSVCKCVDSILMVVETDTTSYQTTQHLVNELSRNKLSDKLKGFIINKVFDDPSVIARSGTAAFQTQYVESIPFDIDATKSFLIGELPSSGLFYNQVFFASKKIFSKYMQTTENKSYRQLSFKDYGNLSLRDNKSFLGGLLISFTSLLLGSSLLVTHVQWGKFYTSESVLLLLFLWLLSFLGGFESFRRSMGNLVSGVLDFFNERLHKNRNL